MTNYDILVKVAPRPEVENPAFENYLFLLIICTAGSYEHWHKFDIFFHDVTEFIWLINSFLL